MPTKNKKKRVRKNTEMDFIQKENMKNEKINNKNSARNLTPKTYFKTCLYQDVSLKCKKKSRKKVKQEDFVIPMINEYEKLVTINFNLSQLKSISRKYKQKVSGNKSQLIFNLYNFLKFSYHAISIQKMIRGYIMRKFIKLHGPAIIDRKCVNDTDFLTFQNIKDIPFQQFYSYKDKDNFVYGFDICSLFNMIKDEEYKKNPYNRNNLPETIMDDLIKIIKMGKKINYNIDITLTSDIEELSEKKQVELRAVSVFQKFDSLGFITNSHWLMGLPRLYCKRYLRELYDVWNYRAQLSNEVKREIYPPNGKIFGNINLSHVLANNTELQLKTLILDICERLITKGITHNAKSLGCFYALGTFTMVSSNCANSLPWLYESFLLQ